MIKITTEQVLMLHSHLIKETGGCDGVRDISLLESALDAPFSGFEGMEIYPSVQQKAARYAYGLVKNHAFIDGNKRIGAHVMLVFLTINGVELEYTQEELVTIILLIASGQGTFEDMLHWILEHQN